jgi:cytochrome c553
VTHRFDEENVMKKIVLMCAAALALAACEKNPVKENAGGDPSLPANSAPPAPPPAPPPPMDPKVEAEQIFIQRCATCHGADGKGTGPAATALPVKPRDYTDATWQKSIDDATLAKVIVEGGQAVGKSPLMTANPDLKDKPEVVQALVAKVRSFAAPK